MRALKYVLINLSLVISFSSALAESEARVFMCDMQLAVVKYGENYAPGKLKVGSLELNVGQNDEEITESIDEIVSSINKYLGILGDGETQLSTTQLAEIIVCYPIGESSISNISLDLIIELQDSWKECDVSIEKLVGSWEVKKLECE